MNTQLAALITEAQRPVAYRIEHLNRDAIKYVDQRATINGIDVSVSVAMQCRTNTSRRPASSLRFKANGKVIAKADLFKLLAA